MAITPISRKFCFYVYVGPMRNNKLCCRRTTARRAISVKILSTVESTTNPQHTEVMELERVTVDRLAVNSHDSSTVVQMSSTTPPTTTTSFVDNAIDLPWRNCRSPEFGIKFQTEVPQFLEIPKCPYNTVMWERWKEAAVPNTCSIRPVVSMPYRLVADRRTDRWIHEDSKYRASIASRGKN